LQPTVSDIYNYYSDGDWRYREGFQTIACTLTARNSCGSSSDTMVIRGRGRDYHYDGDHGYYNVPSNIRVALIAIPKTGCAPVYGVDLEATVYDYGGGNTNFTYYFDCDNNGAWEKIVTTDEPEFAARDLCSYGKMGSYTARVRVETRGRVLTDTDIVKTDDCGYRRSGAGYQTYPSYPAVPVPVPVSPAPIAPAPTGQLGIQKTVSNLSDATQYQTSVTARPLDVLSYKITVSGQAGLLSNVIVRDALPAGLTNIRDLKVDGAVFSGDIKSGINIGNLFAGQTRVITYTATVAAANTITLANAASAYSDGVTATASATVNMFRSPLQAAMAIGTGFADNAWLRILIAALSAAVGLALVARKIKITPFEILRKVDKKSIAR
jgi:uncharacterized repeat protein (TIGR01451 family)